MSKLQIRQNNIFDRYSRSSFLLGLYWKYQIYSVLYGRLAVPERPQFQAARTVEYCARTTVRTVALCVRTWRWDFSDQGPLNSD